MMNQAASPPEPTPCATQEARSFVPVVGQEVIVAGKKAVVTKVLIPGEPRSAIDAVVYHGQIPEANRGLIHASVKTAGRHATPAYEFAHELPPPPPTNEEILAAAAARGERIPSVGETIFVLARHVDMSKKLITWTTRRARVRAVATHELLELDYYVSQAPPEDDREVDAYSTPKANPLFGSTGSRVVHIQKGTGDRQWVYPDQWTCPEPEPLPDLRATCSCSRCGFRIHLQGALAIYDHLPETLHEKLEMAPRARLCNACFEATIAFATTPPALAEPEPAPTEVIEGAQEVA